MSCARREGGRHEFHECSRIVEGKGALLSVWRGRDEFHLVPNQSLSHQFGIPAATANRLALGLPRSRSAGLLAIRKEVGPGGTGPYHALLRRAFTCGGRSRSRSPSFFRSARAAC